MTYMYTTNPFFVYLYNEKDQRFTNNYEFSGLTNTTAVGVGKVFFWGGEASDSNVQVKITRLI